MRNKATLTLVLILTITSLTLARSQRRQGKRPDRQTPKQQPVLQDLTEQETTNILFMREEEKLARDVYVTLGKKWQVQPFVNIAKAEQRHMRAILYLIKKYKLTDPVTDDTTGAFTNEDLSTLYTQLIETGQKDLLSALKVGALIEEKDIFDLRKAVSETDKLDLARVYKNLMRGSRNHLRAFARFIKAQGAAYTVDGKYLTQEEFDKIANSPMERGHGRADRGNRGNRNGRRGRGGREHRGNRGNGNGNGYHGGGNGNGNGYHGGGNGNGRGQERHRGGRSGGSGNGCRNGR